MTPARLPSPARANSNWSNTTLPQQESIPSAAVAAAGRRDRRPAGSHRGAGRRGRRRRQRRHPTRRSTPRPRKRPPHAGDVDYRYPAQLTGCAADRVPPPTRTAETSHDERTNPAARRRTPLARRRPQRHDGTAVSTGMHGRENADHETDQLNTESLAEFAPYRLEPGPPHDLTDGSQPPPHVQRPGASKAARSSRSAGRTSTSTTSGSRSTKPCSTSPTRS